MSATKQIILSLVVILVAAAGWYAYDHGLIFARHDATGQAAVVGPAGGQAGGPGAGGGAPGGQRGGGGGPGGGRGGPTLVVTVPVEMDEAGVDVRAIGTVASARAVTLYAQATGFVVEMLFQPGTKVEAGQTLVRLDDADQQVALDKARIARDTAKAAADRAEQLAKTSNITSVALDDTRAALQKAEIDLEAAANDLAKRIVKAPFAGTIGLSDVTVGDLVNSSKAIATLDDMSKVTVTFEVPERASGMVAVDQAVAATTEALAGQTFKGVISAVDSRVDATSRTLKVEATLPNDANVLRPGMALSVQMSFPGQPHPAVPSLAVQWDRTGSYVWKVANGKAQRVPVQILGRRSGQVVVAAELAEHDAVVVEGLQRLREGGQVTEGGGGGGAPAGAPGQRQPGPGGNGGNNVGPGAGAGNPAAGAAAGGAPGGENRPRRAPSG